MSTQSSLEKRLVRSRGKGERYIHAHRLCFIVSSHVPPAPCAQELFNAYLERNRAFRRSLRESQHARERRTSEAISELAMLRESELGRYHDAICLRGAIRSGPAPVLS